MKFSSFRGKLTLKSKGTCQMLGTSYRVIMFSACKHEASVEKNFAKQTQWFEFKYIHQKYLSLKLIPELGKIERVFPLHFHPVPETSGR